MKGAIVAGLIGAAAAAHQGHAGFHNRRGDYYGSALVGSAPVGTAVGTAVYGEVCSVSTHTYTGEGVWHTPTYAVNTTSVAAAKPTSTAVIVVYPTPEVTTCPTPGTYTFPASTIIVTETTTVCGAKTTVVPPGTHTYGGVTTSVVTATTVICPYATESVHGSTTTSIILTTTYVCPSAGEYTIGPMTTSCSETATLTYPEISTFTPGTYSHEATTITVAVTDYVYVCPFAASTSTAVVYVAPSSVYVAPVYSAPAYSAPAYSAPASSAAAAYTPKASSPSYSTTGNHVVTGNKWAITYTPYTPSGTCQSAEGVMTDIKAIKAMGYGTVRIYSTDCSGLENVGAACKAHGVRLIVGIFIKGDGIPGCTEQVNDIISWTKTNGWGIIEKVIIGNEAIYNKYCTAEALAAYIVEVKTKFYAAGCPKTVGFSTTEPVGTLQEHGASLCSAITFLGANIHAYFDGGVVASKAGAFVKSQLDLVKAVCPEIKEAFNLESGWPSKGNHNGVAIPGLEEQKDAIKSILETCGPESVIMGYKNDYWKEPGALGVEQSWGLADNYLCKSI